MKICNKCEIEKEDFHFAKRGKGLQSECKDCNKKYRLNNKKQEYHKQYYYDHAKELSNKSKTYYYDNKKDILDYKKIYYIDNKEHKQNYNKQYLISNREDICKYQSEYNKLRRSNDPCFALRHRLSVAIGNSLQKFGSSKSGQSILKFLQYSIDELKVYIERQFEPWMNWNNHGNYNLKTWDDNDPTTWTWQIDHIIPHSKFHYTSMEDQAFKDCWALSNLRPYSAKQNIIDGNRRYINNKG